MAASDHPQVEIAASSEHTDELESARTKQQVIMEVLAAHEGEDESAIRQALLNGLLLRGLPIPVEPWLDAVAGELAAGHVYVVAPDLDMSEFDRDVSEPPPSSLT
jgi:hypothetical protein